MFSYCNNLLPTSFDDFFTCGSQIHNYNTRSARNLRSHNCRTTLKQFSISYQGPLFWNSLDSNITNLNNLATFKSRLKEILLASYSS